MSVRRVAILAVLSTALLAPASASADTVQVTVNTDNGGAGCELRFAIETFNQGTPQGNCTVVAAPGDDQITFAGALTGATIDLESGNLNPDGPAQLDIVGPGMSSLTISASTGDRVLRNDASTNLLVSGMTLRDGAPNGTGAIRGGCVYNEGGTMTLTDVRVTNCEAIVNDGAANVFGDGGGIGNDGTLTVNSSLIDGNLARGLNNLGGLGSGSGRGAGIYSETGTLTINDSTIRDNEAVGDFSGDGQSQAYGGIFIAGGPTATISQSTISGNSAEASVNLGDAFSAGGIYMNATVGSIEQTTVAGNTADADGPTSMVRAGGIYSQGPATAIRSSTIALNGPSSATVDGVNLVIDNGTMTVSNSIIADPRGGGDNCSTAGGTLTSAGFNDDYSQGGASCFAVPLATDTDDDPLLATSGLANNGGPTETIPLQATSPLIDAGSNVGNTNLTEDQRGLARPVDFTGLTNAVGGNGTDIGAYEVQLACAGQATPTTTCPSTGGGGGTTPTTPTTTGKRTKALKKCKKIKNKKKRNKCVKKAKKQPV